MLVGRRLLLSLTLVGQLLGSIGVPLPTVRRPGCLADLAYPCQGHACGCLTYQQCWAGDCCCYSLRDKVRYAEAHGLPIPDSARLLLADDSCASRTTSRTAIGGTSGQSDSTVVADERREAVSSCCRQTAGIDSEQQEATTCRPPVCSECTDGGSNTECTACADEPTVATPVVARSAVVWVVAVQAAKCRGDGPTALIKLDPASPPTVTADLPRPGVVVTLTDPASPTRPAISWCPPIPPPR